MTTYLFVGNEAVIDFVNTEVVDHGKGTDLLQSYEDLVRWFAEAGLASRADLRALATRGNAAEKEAALQEAKQLRALLRRSLGTIAETADAPNGLAEHLARFLRPPRLAIDVRSVGGKVETQTRSLLEKPRDLVVAIARRGANFLAEADYSAIRRCEGADCILFFYDTSKNHTRRWCSMDLCGNRAKVAAFRQRG